MKQTLCADILAIDAEIRSIAESIGELLIQQQALLKRSGRLKRRLCKMTPKSAESIPKTIDELRVGKQIKKALKNVGIHLVDELCQKKVTELLLIKNISKKRLDEIEEALEEIDRHLT